MIKDSSPPSAKRARGRVTRNLRRYCSETVARRLAIACTQITTMDQRVVIKDLTYIPPQKVGSTCPLRNEHSKTRHRQVSAFSQGSTKFVSAGDIGAPKGTTFQHEAQHKWYAARSSFDVRWYGKRRSGAKRKGAQNARYEFYDGEEGRRRLTRRVQVRRKRKRRREDAPLASCCRASGIKAGFGKRGGSRAALAGRGRFQGIGWGRRGPVDGTHASCWRGSFDS